MKNLSQSLLVEVVVNRTIECYLSRLTLLVVSYDKARNELAKEDSASIAKNGSILLRTVSLDG